MEQKKESAFTPLESLVPLEKSFLTGFTLLELLIVITLIGILAGIAITRYGPVSESARRAEAYAVLAEIVTAEKRYYLDNDAYAATFADLDSFSAAPASANFTYSVLPVASPVYAEAARINPPSPNSYCMRIDNGCFKRCAGAASCNCSICP